MLEAAEGWCREPDTYFYRHRLKTLADMTQYLVNAADLQGFLDS